MSAAPVIVTERLELWRPAADDFLALYAIVSDERTSRFLGSQSSIADHYMRFGRNAGSWFLYGYGSFIVRLRGQFDPVGNCGVFHSWRGLGDDFDDVPEAGWILRHDLVGKGFAREAMEAALAWFEREHGSRRIVAMIAPENAASIGLATRLAFAPMRDAVLADGEAVRLFERLPAGEA